MRLIRHIGHISPIGLIGPISLICLISLIACSKEDGEGAPAQAATDEEPITFSAQQQGGNAVTRAATSLHDKGIASFRLYGYKNDGYAEGAYTSLQTVIDGYTVSWQTTATTSNPDGDWEYVGITAGQSIKYWDYSARAYRFFAYAPADAANVSKSATENAVTLTTTIDATDEANTPYLSDLWFSTGNAVDYPDRQWGKPVQMQFQKPLARVRFLFIYPENNDLYNRNVLTDVSFGPVDEDAKIAQQGTVSFSYPLKGTATTHTWTSSPSATGSIEAFTEDYQLGIQEKWYNVLPISSQGAFRLTCKVFNDTRTAAVSAEFMTWAPGYEYTYVFKIHDDGGVSIDDVQSAFTIWTIETEKEHPIYNW